MNLLQPQLLWLLAAIAIPIAVHLYNRKRAVKRRFPALEFLLKSNKLLARRLKVRQILLLAMRIGVFLLLPLAIARPFLLSDEGVTDDEKLPSAVVYVVDDSLSMQAEAGGSSRWEAARSAVEEDMEDLRTFDEVALVFASSPEEPPVLEPTDDLATVRRALNNHSATWERVDNRRALEVARDIAMSSELPMRKVILVTDMARGSWPDPLGDDLFGGSAVVELIDVGGSPLNASIVDATVRSSASGERGAREVVASISLTGTDEPLEAIVSLRLEDVEIASTQTELSPDEVSRVVFEHRTDAQSSEVLEVVVDAPGDELAADDSAEVLITSERNIAVLMVNGDPRTLPYQDELFYVEKALRPAAQSASLIQPRVTTQEGFRQADLKGVDVVVLANVSSLDPGQAGALTAFVEDGGGLFITMGNKVDPVSYNRTLGELLPKPLRSERRLASVDDPDAAIKVTRFDTLDFSHPIMRPFSLPGGESLNRVTTYAYMLVEPTTRDDARVLATFADGGPAMLEHRVGAGRVIMLTTTIDRDWTPLPIKKPFLPLVRRTMSYLARRGAGDMAQQAVVGEPYVLPLEGYSPEMVEVLGPDQASRLIERAQLTDLRPTFVPRRPGLHRVQLTENGVELTPESLSFVARVDRRESDTNELSEESLQALWADDGSDGDGVATSGAPERRLELWPFLLLLALMLLYAETLIGLRRSFLLRLKGLFGRSHSSESKSSASL